MLLLIAMVWTSLCAVQGAHAAGSQAAVRVSATVVATCKVLAVQDISFAQLDPSAATDVSASGTVTFACTKGVSYTMNFDRGANAQGLQRRMAGPQGRRLPYEFTVSGLGGRGNGFSTATTVSTTALVRAVDYVDLEAGNYTDTLRLTIEP